MQLPSNRLKNISTNIACLATILLFISGCSYFNETKFENSLGKDVNLINYSYDIADDLVKNAYPLLIPRQQDMSILTTTFVDNNNLQNTSHFGRLLQDHIGSRFVQRGYTVNEIKLRKDLLIEERSGETILSRNLKLLSQSQRAQAILVGTISQSQRTMYISARLINPNDSTIISSKNYRLYMDKNVLAMFNLQMSGGNGETIKPPSEPVMNSVLY
jgi:TolB-like protein